MQAIIGQKVSQTQKFLEDGTRIPVTAVNIAGGNVVVQSKTKDKEGYDSIQLGFGSRKNGNKPLVGHVKKASLKEASLFLKEVGFEGEMPEVGTVIKATDVLKPGDIVDVIGVSKGKGYAGGVKRHNFKGGPRTHGQSDRERAPGSIGQSTTPGRVYKGKRMAGRMGHARVTVANLTIVDVTETNVLIKGLVPGPVNNLIMITKVGEVKKFVPLYKEEVEGVEEVASSDNLPHVSDDVQPSEESKNMEPASLSDNQAPVENAEVPVEPEPIVSSSENGETAATSSEEIAVEPEDGQAPVIEDKNKIEEEKKEIKPEETSSDAKAMEDKENAS